MRIERGLYGKGENSHTPLFDIMMKITWFYDLMFLAGKVKLNISFLLLLSV